MNQTRTHRRQVQKKLLCILTALAAAFAFTLSGCGEEPSGTDVTKGVAGIEYEHCDTSGFDKECAELEALAQTEDADQVISKYDALYAECEKLETMYSVVYVMYSTDVTNDYYSKEQLYSVDQLMNCCDRLCAACSKITEGPCAEQFRAHVGQNAFDAFAGYSVLTDREKKLAKQEKKLVDEYYNILDEAEKNTYRYKGKDWTMDQISGEEGSALSVSDYEGYIEIYDGLLKMTNEKAGPVFLKLVDIRTELANLAGYDDYAAFADQEEYNRDYSEAELNKLHKDVRKVARTYYDNYYSSPESEKPFPSMPRKKLLSCLLKYSDLVDDMAGDSAAQMIDQNLFTMGDESCRQEGAFTTYIRGAGCPFISMTLDGQTDFVTLFHEFGHFVEYNNEKEENILTDEDNIDLAEIASNGYEALSINFYDEIFRSSAKTAQYATLCQLLENVIDGCIEDEFQRAVYENPDMTLDEINALYAKTCARYNSWAEEDPGYAWVFINHNFESPMYYISYSVSALAALQIWNQSNRDFDKAVRTWEKFLKEGTFNKTYLDVVDKCGLMKFTEPGSVRKICAPALKETSTELDFDYDLEN